MQWSGNPSFWSNYYSDHFIWEMNPFQIYGGIYSKVVHGLNHYFESGFKYFERGFPLQNEVIPNWKVSPLKEWISTLIEST